MHHHGARFGNAELSDHRHTDASEVEGHRHCEDIGVLVGVDRRCTEHLQLGERVGVKPGTMPRVEPIGDDVARFAGTLETSDGSQSRASRPGRQHRGVQGLLTTDLVQPDPHQHTVVVGRQRLPAEFPAAGESQSVPGADQAAALNRAGGQVSAQVRTGRRADMQAAVFVPPGDDLHACDPGAERTVAAHIGAGGEHEPVTAGTCVRTLQGGVDEHWLGLLVGGRLAGPVDFREDFHRRVLRHPLGYPGPQIHLSRRLSVPTGAGRANVLAPAPCTACVR